MHSLLAALCNGLESRVAAAAGLPGKSFVRFNVSARETARLPAEIESAASDGSCRLVVAKQATLQRLAVMHMKC